MSKITKFLLAGLCCLLIMVVPAWSVEVGDPMPDFAAQTFDGQQLGRTALMGSPVLLVFWNTWCANCLRELPEINRLSKKFGARGLRIFAINTGYNDSESKARDLAPKK